ncbi:hypothetical protein VLK81_08165 [Citroniella saccharovorans]|uniref:Uncharacterized protein n=1 Tax=Citroniella saccharovorans TaxID=2053367 RepID=A0AAW9MS98_9FIRM|nr:hypothetical protein [Citroniella saccharovorans]MEB3429981.1 hypothetical protein [Citroniella saccharovorans]
MLNIAFLEAYISRYDLRYLLNGIIALSDGEKPYLPLNPLLKMKLEKLIKGTDIEEMLKEFNII